MARFFLFLLLSLHLSITLATSLAKDKIPAPLKPWVSWVLQGEESYQCPFFYNDFLQKKCNWPGKLKLELNADEEKLERILNRKSKKKMDRELYGF